VDPLLTSTKVARHVAPDGIESVTRQRNVKDIVRRAVVLERSKIAGTMCGGVNMDGSIGSYAKFSEMNKMDVVIAKHNDPANDFHLDVQCA
jgi:hypothetical protein